MRQFPSTPQDWFNCIAQGTASNGLIQYVVKLARSIDYETLKKAVLHSITAEPVLGCKLMIEAPHPKWVPVEFEIQDICCLIETQDVEQEINTVLGQTLNVSTRIPIMVCVITDNKSTAVVIKINHAVCDGAGSKYYLKLLAKSYTNVREGNFVISQNNSPTRNTSELYSTLGIKKIEDHFDPKKIDLASTWGFPIHREKAGQQYFSYQLKTFKNLGFHEIKTVAAKNNTSINTILVAAYHFALMQVLQPSSGQLKEIQLTSDLRKYLPKNTNQTICNLSAVFNVELPATLTYSGNRITETAAAIEKANRLDNIIHRTFHTY